MNNVTKLKPRTKKTENPEYIKMAIEIIEGIDTLFEGKNIKELPFKLEGNDKEYFLSYDKYDRKKCKPEYMINAELGYKYVGGFQLKLDHSFSLPCLTIRNGWSLDLNVTHDIHKAVMDALESKAAA